MSTWTFRNRAATGGLVFLFALTARADTPASTLAIAFSSETSFQPLPCDCPIESLGGWASRAAILSTLDADHVIADAGGWLSADLPPDLVALTTHALALMPYDAVNVGAMEWPWLTSVRDSGVPLVCGHPDRPADVPAFRIVFMNGRRVAIVGAAWFGKGILPPVEQVSRALEDVGKVDATLVLCAGGWGDARAIAISHPDVDVVLYGGGAKTETPSVWNGVYGAAPGSKGRHVGDLQLALTSGNRPAPSLTLIPVKPDATAAETPVGRLALEAAILREGGSAAWARKQFSYVEE